jgi:hypothetical protein
VLREVEGAKEWGRVHECREQRQDSEEVKLRNQKHLRWVHIVPMTQLMCFILETSVSNKMCSA